MLYANAIVVNLALIALNVVSAFVPFNEYSLGALPRPKLLGKH
jgi:hypothetical protein